VLAPERGAAAGSSASSAGRAERVALSRCLHRDEPPTRLRSTALRTEEVAPCPTPEGPANAGPSS